MKPRFSIPLMVCLPAVAAVWALPDAALGQPTRARLGSNSLGGFGSVGRTIVSEGDFLRREQQYDPYQLGGGAAGGRFAYQQGGVSAGNYDPRGGGGARNPFGSGMRGPRRRNALSPFAQPPIGVYNAFANPLSFGLARQRAPITRDYTGRNSWSQARAMRFGAGEPQGSAYMALQNSKALLHRYAFFGPVRAAHKGGRIRDELTNTTLENMPDSVEARLDESVPRQSFSQIMENRLFAERNQRIAMAWEHFMRGRYQVAIGHFQCAAVRRHEDPEPKVGILLSEIAAQQPETARVVAAQLIPDLLDRPRPALPGGSTRRANPFRCDINLRDLAARAETLPSESAEVEDEVLAEMLTPLAWSEEQLDEVLQVLAIEAEQDPDPSTAALQVFLLWYAGDRQEALRVAQNLRRVHETSQFAQMVDHMNEAMKEPASVEGQANATP